MKYHVYRISLFDGAIDTRITKTDKDQISVTVNDSINLLYKIGKNNVQLLTAADELAEECKDHLLLAVCIYMVPEKIADPIIKELQCKLNKQ